LDWVPPRTYSLAVKKAVMKLLTPAWRWATYFGSFFLPVNWELPHFREQQ